MSRWRQTFALILYLSVLLLLPTFVFFTTWLSALYWSTNERISFGEKALIPEKSFSNKKDGMKAIKDGKWNLAIEFLEKSLKNNPNDPEALIFLNNARIGSRYSYNIAVSVPIPKNIKSSLEILRGVAQAQYEINDVGGINRVPLKVAIASDDDNPKVAQEVATALANNPNILGVVGHYASDVTIAAKNIYTSRKLVAITPISTSVCLRETSRSNSICPDNFDNSKNSKIYVFRTVTSDTVTAQVLANHMFKNLKTNNNVAVFYSSESNYSKSLMSEFKKVVLNAKGQVREIDLYKQGFNADSSIQAIGKDTQVLMLAVDTVTLPKALDVIRSVKKKFKILAGDDVYTSETLKVGDKALGMVVAAFWDIDTNSNSKFVNQSQKLWGKGAKVNWRTALAYDATRALIAAIESNPNRIGVQQALSSPKFKITGASGNIEFSASGDRKNADNIVRLVEIVPTDSSNTDYKFLSLAAASSQPTVTSTTTNTPTPTNTPKSTNNPKPTNTPTPTNTPKTN